MALIHGVAIVRGTTLAGLSAVLLSCAQAREPTQHDKDLVLRWLTCGECTEGEMDSVVSSVERTTASGLLGDALTRTPPAVLTNVRIAAGAQWTRVGGTPQDSAAWVSTFTANYLATMQRRAAIALGTLGDTATLRAALADSARFDLRQDVRRVIRRSLEDAGAPGFLPPGVAQVVARPDSFRLATGSSQLLEAVVLDADGAMLSTPVTWTSSDPEVARVDTVASGRWSVSAREPGHAVLTATARGVSGSTSVTVASEPARGPLPPLLTIRGGNHQVGRANRLLDSALVVRVTRAGVPMYRVSVAWTLRQGGVDGPTHVDSTGVDGTASYRLRLGQTPGLVVVTAFLVDAPSQRVRFILQAR